MARYRIQNGQPQFTGPVPSSNKFHRQFFWEFSSGNLARAGFDDGDLAPFKQWPPKHALGDGENAHAKAGTFKGRKSLQLYWSRRSYDHWKDRNARLGKGIEVESPWKNGGFTSRKEVWYSFDLLVPAPNDPQGGFPDDKKQGICQIFQITDGDGGSWAAMLVIENNRLLLRHRNPSKEVQVVDQIPRGKWKHVLLHTVASTQSNGTVELWYGGEKVYTETGTNFGWGADFTDQDRMAEGDYLFAKLGHYAFQANKYDRRDERTLYYDNITNVTGKHGNLNLRIEAENFRASNDDTGNNIGGKYRPSSNVDIGVSDDGLRGYYVGWTEGGEWLDYLVHVPEAGTYNLNFRVASTTGQGRMGVGVKGVGSTGNIRIPDTGGKQKWSTIQGPPVKLDAGKHAVRVGILKGGFNLDWFELVPSTKSNKQ